MGETLDHHFNQSLKVQVPPPQKKNLSGSYQEYRKRNDKQTVNLLPLSLCIYWSPKICYERS